MRSRKVIERKYDEYCLRFKDIQSKLEDYCNKGKPLSVNTEYENMVAEQEMEVMPRMFTLAWVLGYAKTP